MKNKNKHQEPKSESLKKMEAKKHFPLLSEEEYFYLYMTAYLSDLKITVENSEIK